MRLPRLHRHLAPGRAAPALSRWLAARGMHSRDDRPPACYMCPRVSLLSPDWREAVLRRRGAAGRAQRRRAAQPLCGGGGPRRAVAVRHGREAGAAEAGRVCARRARARGGRTAERADSSHRTVRRRLAFATTYVSRMAQTLCACCLAMRSVARVWRMRFEGCLPKLHEPGCLWSMPDALTAALGPWPAHCGASDERNAQPAPRAGAGGCWTR